MAIGAVLLSSNNFSVGYSSRALSKSEKNYLIIELELIENEVQVLCILNSLVKSVSFLSHRISQ